MPANETSSITRRETRTAPEVQAFALFIDVRHEQMMTAVSIYANSVRRERQLAAQ
jgi:hypothetical protein